MPAALQRIRSSVHALGTYSSRSIPEAKKGFVLLPRRWVVERSFGSLNRFRRLARDYERLPETLAGLHFVVFVSLMLTRAAQYF